MRPTLALPLFLLGCAPDLDFSSDATTVTATAREDGTTEVRVCAGPSDLFSCNDREAFRVAVGDAVLEGDDFTTQLFGGQLAYVRDAGDAPIVVTRLRDGAQMSVSLPPRFALSGPAAGTTISRREGLRLAWDASGRMAWSATADCADGSFAVRSGETSARSLALRGDGLPAVGAGGCRLTVAVDLTRGGAVDDAFADGSGINGVRERTLVLALAP